MATDDLKTQALNSSQDFYALLDLSPAATESELRRAYRKTALKYHPDKVGPANTAALEKFHLLQLAYDVLSDPAIRELYDNARKAREAKVERERAFEGRRRAMKEDLERRESGAVGAKRKREDAEEEFERELRRLAEDGKRRRKEREEMLRKEAVEMAEEDSKREEGEVEKSAGVEKSNGEVPDVDRSVTLRFPLSQDTAGIDKQEVISRFQRFGAIDDAILRDKKIKVEGEKHRQAYKTAVIVFKSVVGAHAAIADFPKLSKSDSENLSVFEAVNWAGGKEPDYIPKPGSASQSPPVTPVSKPDPERRSKFMENFTPAQNVSGGNGSTPAAGGLKKVPSFGSFKGTPVSANKGQNSPSLDEITMIRLKNAERRRMEEKIRKEDAAAAEADGQVNEASE